MRYLSDEVDNRTEQELQVLVNELAGDVAGTKEHAKFQHERVRYLQTAVTNVLNIKQNEIIKVFTIVTAVFLPPTLIGTLYGMNFAVMPELSWQHGFIYAMCLTSAPHCCRCGTSSVGAGYGRTHRLAQVYFARL